MDDTFNPTLTLNRTDTLTNLPGASKTPTTSIKQPKSNTTASSTSNYPRLDLEPLYTDLKDAIGPRWDTYSDALTRFVRGTLHAREFADLTDETIYASDAVLHLHNKFVCAIAFNAARDQPEPGVAVWVTAAADKSSSTAATKAAITSDVGEQRLKKEVMALHARDRRRLKGMAEDGKKAGGATPGGGAGGNTANNNNDDIDAQYIRRNPYEESYNASRYKVPEIPQTQSSITAGALSTKTNLEPEIKKRYQQSLFAESAEFPDATSVYARMIPICYEEAIPQGASMACAELAVIGAEFYFKDFLNTVFERVRVNGPRYDNGVGGGVYTSRFQKQVAREEELVKDKKLARTREDDLLPVEAAASRARRPLGVADVKLAGRVGTPLWTRTPLLGFEVEQRVGDGEYDDWREEMTALKKSGGGAGGVNGHVKTVKGASTGTTTTAAAAAATATAKDDDDMDIDSDDGEDDDFDWIAEGFGGRDELDTLMNNCLTINAP